MTFILTHEPNEEWTSRLGTCRFNFLVAEGGNPTLPKVTRILTRSAAQPFQLPWHLHVCVGG